MVRIALLALLSLVTIGTTAQNTDSFEEFRRRSEQAFEQARTSHDNRFEEHRAEINRRYADHLRRVWERYNASPSEEAPRRPEPIEPPQYIPPTDAPTEKPIVEKPIAEVVVPPAPQPIEKPKPNAKPIAPPISQPIAPQEPNIVFEFYGTLVSLRVPGSGVPSLFELSEERVASGWLEVSKSGFDKMLEDCLAERKRLNIGDWGYYCLVRDAATCYYGAQCNDNILLQAYLLAHSGYSLRLARSDNRLYMLVNVAETMYGQPFFTIEGKRYYFVESRIAPSSLLICNVAFPGEKGLSLKMATPPQLSFSEAPTLHFASKRYPELYVDLTPNKNLIDFYASYPTTPMPCYVHTSLSSSIKESLYPALQKACKGRSQREAVGMVLNFVQTAFAYKSDTYQFGREKWFFADEMFFYPYCDCDDRAILLAVLVREVLGVEAVLLDYPEHVAVAVHIAVKEADDVVEVDGAEFVVCDPTYINAGVGMAMSGLDRAKLKIVKL